MTADLVPPGSPTAARPALFNSRRIDRIRRQVMSTDEAHAAAADIKRMQDALRAIAERDWVENVLDPQWAAMFARESLHIDGCALPGGHEGPCDV